MNCRLPTWLKRPTRDALLTLAASALIIVGGCEIPADPAGTFHRVHSTKVVRVGVSEQPPWTSIDEQEPTGIENQLLLRYARRNQLQIEWIAGSESELMRALQSGQIDVLLGGFTSDSPWIEYAGATRPYLRRHGKQHVLLVRAGENRWLLELDRFLHDERGTAAALLALYEERPNTL